MKIIKTIHSNEPKFEGDDFDLFVACSGYEKRATFLHESQQIKVKEKVCVCFDTHRDELCRVINDTYFQKTGFSFIECSSDDFSPLKSYLNEFLLSFKGQSLKLLIDYSSMSRVWYSYFLSYFSYVNIPRIEVELTFSYTNSKFVTPEPISAYKSFIAPIEGYYSIMPPIKPTALIIGLGYLERQAYGLAEYFEAEPFLFINKNSEEDKFYTEVIDRNKALINSVNKANIFDYSLNNLFYSEAILTELCRDLQSKYRVVIAPCGPKPFTLISLLTSLKVGYIDVWRISAQNNNSIIEKIPSGDFSVTTIIFTSK